MRQIKPFIFISVFLWCVANTLAYADSYFLLTSGNNHRVLLYNENGDFVEEFIPFVSASPLRNPRGIIEGPDGNVYVSSNRMNTPGNAVLRYDGLDGDFIDVFAKGPLDPFGMVFGPDGNLYVSGTNSSNIVRFNGTTGAFIDIFASNSALPGTLSGPRGLVFSQDGDLYVANPGFGNVARYDGSTGTFLGPFAAWVDARDLVFASDGNLYVTSFSDNSVYRFNGTTGEFVDVFVANGSGGLSGPVGLRFGPDGNLYVGSFNNHRVLRYHGTTGEFIDEFVPNGLGSLVTPRLFIVVERETIQVSIDVKPEEEPNPIDPARKGLVPVAILSSASFDATAIDPATLRLASAGVQMSRKRYLCHSEDVGGGSNGSPDGLLDLVCQFKASELAIKPGADTIRLTGKVGDVYIRGENSIVQVGN